MALETEDKRESGVGDLNEDGVAGGIEYGFMSFTTDRGRVTEEAERLRREAEEETARKRREVEEAEEETARKRREVEEAERKRRETARKRREVEEAEHPRAFLRDDARPEVPQRGHHQVALVIATPSHFRSHIASDEDLQNIHDI